MSERFPESPWEKNWREYEQGHLGRRQQGELSEEDKILLGLSERTIHYLSATGIANNRAIPEPVRAVWKDIQVDILRQMTPDDMGGLCQYISWSNQRKGVERWKHQKE